MGAGLARDIDEVGDTELVAVGRILLAVLVLDIKDVEGLICNLYIVYIQGDEWIGQRVTEAAGTKIPFLR